MGYKREKKIFNLVFEDPELQGLEVRARSTSMGQFQVITRQMLKLEENPDNLTMEDVDNLDDLFGRFAAVLISWNLEDVDEDGHDVPVPPTKDGLLSQDPKFVMAIVQAWAAAVSSVDAELGKGSTSGANFPEVTIPMAPLSSSPGS